MNTTDKNNSPSDQIETCCKCHRPIDASETGLRHFGFRTAHLKSRCIQILIAEIDSLKESVDEYRMVARHLDEHLVRALRGLERDAEPVARSVVAWVRPTSDGRFEGPLFDWDKRMDDVRRASGVWRALTYADAPPASSGTVQVPRLVATAPKRIYLGVFDDIGVEQQDFPEDHEGITWCTDNVGHADVEYIRADLAAAPGAK